MGMKLICYSGSNGLMSLFIRASNLLVGRQQVLWVNVQVGLSLGFHSSRNTEFSEQKETRGGCLFQ